jgi:hypothetical protein
VRRLVSSRRRKLSMIKFLICFFDRDYKVALLAVFSFMMKVMVSSWKQFTRLWPETELRDSGFFGTFRDQVTGLLLHGLYVRRQGLKHEEGEGAC